MIERDAYDDHGLRYARCTNCSMGWVEHERQPGAGWLPAGARDHDCPEPFDRETAERLLSFYATTGVPTSQRVKARIKLGLLSFLRGSG